jgi:hypothetical protein
MMARGGDQFDFGTAPAGPHLVVRLKARWRYDSRHRRFVSATGNEFSLRGQLPKRTRITPTAPDLARRAPERLSPEERDLARYVQLVPPKPSNAKDLLAQVRRWPCVESAQLSPTISLP